MKTILNHSSLPFNQAAAVVLTAAVTELFPGALFLSGQGTDHYFFYDFVFPFEFQSELLTLIEERMRLILKEKRPIKVLEMMPLNAADLMRHQGQELAAELLSTVERATVLLCQIGDFAIHSPDFSPEELVIPFFKVFEAVISKVQGQSIVRIIGSASNDKTIVKNLFKKTPYSAKAHAVLADQGALLAPIQETASWVWRPRGEIVRRALIQWWMEAIEKQNISFVSMPTSGGTEEGERALIQAHLDYFIRFQEPRVAQMVFLSGDASQRKEGFFSPEVCCSDRTYLFCSDQHFLEECISSLHFILQIPKLLGFEFELVLSVSLEAPKSLRSQSVSLWEKVFEREGLEWSIEKVIGTPFVSCVEVRIADALGRKWTGPFIGIPIEPMPVGKGKMLVRSSLGSFERILALLLENTAGWLPTRLAPEQVRLIVLTPSAKEYADLVCKRLQELGVRVGFDKNREDRLKLQLSSAFLDKVPYVVLLGEKEVAGQTVTLHNWTLNGVVSETGREQSLSLDAFCVKLNSDLFNMRSRNSELTH